MRRIKSLHMKKFFIFLLLTSSLNSFCQDDHKDKREKKGFKRENLFTGGGVNASFSSYITVLGATPHFGYSLTNWADVAVVLNYDYIAQKDFGGYGAGDKARQTV